MPIIITIILLCLSVPAHAGFRMYGKNGQFVNATESHEEIAERYQREDEHRASANAIETDAWRARDARESSTKGKPSPSIPYQCPPQPNYVNKYNDGPDPGGHRRHVFRDKYGFGTPAGMYNAIRAERKALQRERKAAAKREANRKAQTVTMPKF